MNIAAPRRQERTAHPSAHGGLAAAAVLLGLTWAPALCEAQTLDNDYWISAQSYYPSVDTNVRVSSKTAETVGTDIDFEKDLDLDKRDVLPAVSAGARFGHVIVGFDFFKLKRSGSIALQRDITFDDTVYPASAQLDSSFDSDIYRLTVGYAFVQQDNLELGAAIGLHATRFNLALSGEVNVGEGSVQAEQRRKDFLAPIPTVGLFGTYRIAPRLEASARIDYLSLKIDQYDGRLINAQAGVNYSILKNLSLGIAYRYVDYRVGIDKDAWSGRVRYKLNGPAVVLQASF
ncbi:hypothetical protein [Sphingomonas sp. IC081]|uniref:hypothetical protein n=1 Tax=Sphingomonas sp. IC081 TaxID=304378 RepID=UPI0021AF6BA1|nr:hypothetical protein [Sphingomonas sp. IC081]